MVEDAEARLVAPLEAAPRKHDGGRRVRKHAGAPSLKQHCWMYRGGRRAKKRAGAPHLKQHRGKAASWMAPLGTHLMKQFQGRQQTWRAAAVENII
jgi:hypothetical protein